jgi:flagellar biosynthesis/type III secretory pathway chaperone
MLAQVDLGALVITVEEEDQGLSELQELVRLQTDLLVAGAHRDLLENLGRQEKILRRLGKLEEQRLRLLEELVSTGQLADPPARLGELAERLPAAVADRVRALARTIADRAADIQQRERRNQRLLEAGRRCLDGFLGLILSTPEPITYGDGEHGAAEPRVFSGQA